MEMTKLEFAFKCFTDIRETIAKVGVGINIRDVGKAIDCGLDVFADAIAELNTKEPVRNIVQITGSDNRLYALCDNGEIWEMNHDGIWTAYPSIPQENVKP